MPGAGTDSLTEILKILVPGMGTVLLLALVIMSVWDAVVGMRHAFVTYLPIPLIAAGLVSGLVPAVRKSKSLLRLAELCIFMAAAAFVLLRDHAFILQHEPLAAWNRSMVHFLLLMTLYALFIPNQWRRSSAVLFVFSLGPLALAWSTGVSDSSLMGEAVIVMGTGLLVASVGAALVSLLLDANIQKSAETQYDMFDRLGSGGMGEVWFARHRTLARPAAMKIIRPDLVKQTDRAATKRLLGRFEREAQATAALRSPNTVEVYDFGRTNDGIFYYVMEYLDGYDFETLVEQFGPLGSERAVYLLEQVCSSLTEAHEQGLVHRDIKPANLYLSCLGACHDFVKVLDFGLVKPLPGIDVAGLSLDGEITGTPAYIAPEVARGDPVVDARSDIYALGCVAYYLLTGQFVFDKSNAMHMAVAHASEEPDAPSTRTELSIPEDVDAIVMKCLAKDPANRFQSAEQLAEALMQSSAAGKWGNRDAKKWWAEHRGQGAGRVTLAAS